MGSWAHGMRDSDGAMDAIDGSREAIDAFILKPTPLLAFLQKQAKKAGEGDVGVFRKRGRSCRTDARETRG